MRTFGRLTFDGRSWVVDAEPHVILRAKRIFARLDSRAHGSLKLSDTAETARELEWFMERYPLDIDPRWGATLSALGPNVTGATVDYLERPAPSRRYQLGITNPPYDGGAEAAHLEKMLDECDRVIALLPARSLHGLERFERVWSRFRSEWWLREKVHLVRRPKFGPRNKDGCYGGSDEIVLLDMHRGCPGECRVRWV